MKQFHVQNFIAGQFLGAQSQKTISNMAPATNQNIGSIPQSQKEDVDLAVQAALNACPTWSALSSNERSQWLSRIAQGIEKYFDDFAALESLDTGKPISLCKNLDIPRAIQNFRFFSEILNQSPTRYYELSQSFSYYRRKPLGVVGLITPWNLPLYLLSWKIAPALAMGNTIVAKPSELTPLTAHRLCQLLEEIGFPPGVFNLIHGYGQEAAEPIVSHKKVNAISFTGGTATGKQVNQTASQSFKKISLELGGKNPTLVFSDAPLKQTIEGVFKSSFLNQGQICLCGSRILIEDSIYEDFKMALIKRIKECRIGDPSHDDTNFGSLISHAHREKVEKYVQMAKDEGGKVLVGGQRPKLVAPFNEGAFFEPTLVEGLDQTCKVIQEEVFGPLVTLQKFHSEEEALQLANDTGYGLAASLWTQNLSRAHRVAAKIEVGTVWVNTWLLRDLRVPFGGVKASGVGREGGELSLDFFSEPQTICMFTGSSQ